MGEYAKRRCDGAVIKIGTCEDMYYLRASQVDDVQGIANSVNPSDPVVRHELRFRFPWPDEDGTLPGEYDSAFDRAMPVPGLAPARGVQHHTVQFVAQRAGYLVSLPCPESDDAPTHGLTVHRNGFAARVLLTQQKWLTDGRLVPVVRCGGCGTAWRMEDPADIEELAVCFRSAADRSPNDARQFHAIADRILAGARIAPDPLTLAEV